MALTIINTPGFAGTTEADKRDTNHLPTQVFEKPIWDEILWQQTNKWWLTQFLAEYASEGVPVGANSFNWAEDGKIFEKQTIVAGTTESAPGSGIFTTEMSGTAKYFIVNDIIDTGIAHPTALATSVLGRVTAVATGGGGGEEITFELLDPNSDVVGVIVPADFVATNEFCVLYNLQGECFTIPDGRIHTPGEYSNNLNKISNTYEACDDAVNRTIWFKTNKGRYYWTDQEEFDLLGLHRMQCDSACMFGQTHSFTSGGYSGVGGQGIVPYLSTDSLTSEFAVTVLEDDLIEMITELGRYSKFKTWHVICGSTFFKDAQKGLRDYNIAGSIYYGEFSGQGGNKVGINSAVWQFGDRSIKFMEYMGFSDPDFLPINANGVNWLNTALWLNLEGDSIKLKFKKRRDGGIVKDWLSKQVGPTMNSNGGYVQTDQACLKNNWTTHVGVQFKGVQSHGLMTEA